MCFKADRISLIWCIICITLLVSVTGIAVSDKLKVTLSHGGVLVGRNLKSNHGRYVRGFLGIPFAKPPIDDLRFKAPVPADPWSGEKMAIEDGKICSQMSQGKYVGTEDCLYLNVYVPLEPNSEEPLPVMVWIHGGGFTDGSGTISLFNPKLFMDRDVVFVSINYRLNTLGFLSSETLDMPGNFGLKDQQMALKWIKQHISSFGGDENSITIFGGSAGGASVTYHTISENSKGLFHRVITTSGSFYNKWAVPSPKGYAAGNFMKIAKYVGCDTNNPLKSISECLRTVSAKSLTEAHTSLIIWEFAPNPAITVVVEPEHEDAFLTSPPTVTAYSNSIPMMMGFNIDEGLLLLLYRPTYNNDFEQFKKELETLTPYGLEYRYIAKENEEFVKKSLFDFYFENGKVTGKSQNLTDMFSDAVFLRGIDEHIQQRLSKEYPAAPTYLFQFSQQGNIGLAYSFAEENLGVCHGDEIYYLFSSAEETFPTLIPSERDLRVSENMLDMFYNFAAVGNPTPANTYLPRWTPIDSYPPKSMRIGSKNVEDKLLELTDNYPTSRMSFWHKLNPHLGPQPIESLNFSFL